MNDMMLIFCIGLFIGCLIMFLIYNPFWRTKSFKIILKDGTILFGRRLAYYGNQETRGFHHFLITQAQDTSIIGRRIAIPLSDLKYLIFMNKGEK